MPDTPYYRALSRTIKRAFFVLTIIFFLILCTFAWVIHDIRNLTEQTAILTIENTKRIQEHTEVLREIQVSRISSCEHTYDGIQRVFFKAFVEPEGSRIRPEAIDNFNAAINRLKAGCVVQTGQDGG